MFLLALSALNGALASSDSSSSTSEGACNVVKQSEQFLHSLQAGNHRDLHSMYSRTALRYNNGELSRFSDGKPWSVAQATCVAKRVNMVYEVTHFTRDWTHRSASLAVKMTIDTEAPLDVLINLEFNRHDCSIENEHYYYATEHPAYQRFVSKTLDDCWGEDVKVSGPMDGLLFIQGCWNLFLAGTDLNGFLRCFASDATWNINGAPAPASFGDPAYWRAAFNTIKWDQATARVQLVQDRADNTVGAVASLRYRTRADGTWYPITYGMVFTLRDGVVGHIEEVYDERLWAPGGAAIAAVYGSGAPTPASELVWTHPEAVAAYETATSFYGKASQLHNVNDGTGKAVFNGEANVAGVPVLGCLAAYEVYDEAILATPALPGDAPRHFQNVYAVLPMEIAENSRIDVQRVTRSLVYVPAAGAIIARGDSIQSVVGQLYLAREVAMGKMSVSKAQSQVNAIISSFVKVDASNVVLKYKPAFYEAAEAVCQ